MAMQKLFEFVEHLGKWRVLVQTRDIQNGAVKTAKIGDKAITEEKLDDGAVTWKKLNRELQQIIASKAEGGIALSDEWGDSDLIGITQKKLSQAHADLQAQIDAIVSDRVVVSLAATPSLVMAGVESSIALVASSNMAVASIKVKKGATEIASGSGTELTCTDTITPQAGETTYVAEFTSEGVNKTAEASVTAVWPIKYGAGSDYTDATTQASVRTTPEGTYNINIPSNGSYVFLVVPRDMSISHAQMSGFDFPLEEPVNVEIGGVEYKYYQSSNTYDAGTLTIVIS